MVTRRDVAKRAGVSTAAVSYVINNKPGVSETTRQRVRVAIQELGYKPNYTARILKTKRTHHLTIFVNYLGDPFEAGLLDHLEHRARERGYYVSFQTYKPEDEENFLSEAGGRIDGIILLGQRLQDRTLEALNAVGIPVISVQEPTVGTHLTACIDIDWHAAMRQLVQHLTRLGHQSIGFMANGKDNHPQERRRAAFHSAMEAAGLVYGNSEILIGGGRLEIAQAAMSAYLKENGQNGPTAWIAASDLMAVGMVTACKEAGIEVPKQLSIAGCENILMTLQTTPPITVLNYPRKDIARIAVDLMIQTLNGESVQSHHLACQLVPRGSTDKFLPDPVH